mgnify:CR=1 FL=1|tara:strand:+ start:8339 stop:8857 length:519 start_codon:yes stop_codon:yes gene_type:complete
MHALVATLMLTAAIPASDRAIIEHAARCGVDPYLGARFLEIETLAAIPERLRGMTLAKACMETRGNPNAIGDGGKAVGIVQLWPWAEQFIHDRTDPVASIHVLLGRLVTTERTVHRYCPGVRDRWRLAWIRINRGPFWRRPDRKGEARCSGTSPAGLKVLRRWRRLTRQASR